MIHIAKPSAELLDVLESAGVLTEADRAVVTGKPVPPKQPEAPEEPAQPEVQSAPFVAIYRPVPLDSIMPRRAITSTEWGVWRLRRLSAARRVRVLGHVLLGSTALSGSIMLVRFSLQVMWGAP